MEIFGALLELTIINLILSIDNAVLIASVTKDLPDKKRKQVSFFGTIAALIIRFVFILVFLYLFKEEFASIYLLGGIFLVGIGLFITNEKEGNGKEKKINNGFVLKLIFLVVLIDILMSFDNALVVADIASKLEDQMFWQIFIIIFALGMSFPIILFGANKFGKILHDSTWIIYIASFLLVSIGIEMIFEAGFIWANINYEEWIPMYQTLLFKRLTYVISGVLVTSKYFYDKHGKSNVVH